MSGIYFKEKLILKDGLFFEINLVWALALPLALAPQVACPVDLVMQAVYSAYIRYD